VQKFLAGDVRMKTFVGFLIGLAGLFVTAGCEEHHSHHRHHYGGAYDGTDRGYGRYEQWPGYPAHQGYWDRTGDWHPH
jgi:hypothetical protein